MMHIYRLTVVMMRLHSSAKFELVQWIRQRLGATLEAATMIGRTAHAASWRFFVEALMYSTTAGALPSWLLGFCLFKCQSSCNQTRIKL